jgi:putative peptide zinc metalloprotease protein
VSAQISPETVVELHRLHIGPPEDAGQHEVGRPETGVFVALPTEGVSLLNLLRQGLTLRDAEDRFAEQYGMKPELSEFIAAIIDCGFVKAIDGMPADNPADSGDPAGAPRAWRLFNNIPAHRLSWTLTRPARLLYAAIWIAVPALLAVRPDLAPRASQAIITRSAVLNTTILMTIGWLLVFLHELAHLVAARARGCSGALSLSRRFYFLVAQTDMSGVRAIPRKQRYAPYLAGLTLHLAILLACMATEAERLGGRIPGVIAYLVTIQIVFQFAIFLRTDIYYVVSNYLRLGNLSEDTSLYLKSRWNALTGRTIPDPVGAIPPRERRIVRWYSVFYVFGMLAAAANFIIFALPLIVILLLRSLETLLGNADITSKMDSAVFICLCAFNAGLPLAIMARDFRARRAYALTADRS